MKCTDILKYCILKCIGEKIMKTELGSATVKIGNNVERIRKLTPMACTSCLTKVLLEPPQIARYFVEMLTLAIVNSHNVMVPCHIVASMYDLSLSYFCKLYNNIYNFVIFNVIQSCT